MDDSRSWEFSLTVRRLEMAGSWGIMGMSRAHPDVLQPDREDIRSGVVTSHREGF